mgnify:CR=1 FL=1
MAETLTGNISGSAIAALVLVLLISNMPMGIHHVDGDTGVVSDIFTVELKTELIRDGSGLRLEIKDVVAQSDHIRMGLTGGNVAESIVDPTPGTPQVPLLATTIDVPGRLVGARLQALEWDDFQLEERIPLMTEAVNPWDGKPTSRFMKGAPSETSMVDFDMIGYRHVEGQRLTTYSIWIRPVKVLSPFTLSHASEAILMMETESEPVEPKPSRAEGDPENVPGTISVTPYMDVRPQYMIVTSEDLKTELQKLADWKNSIGVATSVVSIEDVTSEYSGSVDEADLLRAYIRDVKERWDVLEFVLLAGDWDLVPAKRIVDSDPYPGWDDGFIPADSYYQCIDGTWDLDDDGQFGEVGDVEDIIPDISVSRLAINDPEIWIGKIEQIISYDRGDFGFTDANKAVLIGANTHSEGDGSKQSDYLWEKYGNQGYDSSVELYEDEGTLSNSEIDRNLESGVGFVNFIDHGGPNEWCDNYGAGVVYRSRDARSLDNGVELPFVSTLACLTTWFDDTSGSSYNFEDCIGEAFTENVNGGAIGYVGSSRTSVGILGAGRYLPYDNGLQEDMIREISTSDETVVGKLFSDAKAHYAEIWGNQFSNVNNPEVMMCWMEYTLLGEVSVDIRKREPLSIDAEIFHEDDLDPHILINVKDGSGYPLEGGNVTLINFKRSVYCRDETDPSGEAVFDLDLDWFCEINLTVTMEDHRLFTGNIRISDVIPPTTTVKTQPQEPEGEDGWFLQVPSLSLVPNEEAKVHYRIGTEGYLTTNSTQNFTVDIPGEGRHEIHYFSEDIAGNLEEEKHLKVKVDIKDPTINLSLSPEVPDGLSGIYTVRPLISLERPKNEQGSPVYYYYRIDSSDAEEYKGSFFLDDGEHTLDIWARDASGRTSNHTILNLTVDTTPPKTTYILDPASPGENGWYTRTPVLRFQSDEDNALTEYRTSQDGDFRTYTIGVHLPDGAYTVEFRSRDQAGNLEDIGYFDVKIDTTSPEIDYSIDPPQPDGKNGFYVTTPRIEVKWEDNIGADLFQRLDNGELAQSDGIAEIPDGEHKIMFFAVDRSGRESDRILLEIKVDTTIPETETGIIGTLRNGWYTTVPIITLSSSEVCSIDYRFDSGEMGDYYMPIETPGREGVYILYFRGEDVAGNLEREKSIDIKVDAETPRLVYSFSDKGEGRYRFDLSGSSDGGDSIEFRLTEGDDILRDWTTERIVYGELSPGRHMIRIEARDVAGNVEVKTVTINVPEESRMLNYAIWGIIGLLILIGSLIVVWIMVGKRGKVIDPSDYQREGSDPYKGISYENVAVEYNPD